MHVCVQKNEKMCVIYLIHKPQTNKQLKTKTKQLTVVVVNPAEAWLALILSVLLELKDYAYLSCKA